MNSIEELEEELENILPNGFRIETNANGQIIIVTNLCEDDDGDLVEFINEDDDEEDPDFDPDFEPLEDEEDDED